MAQGTEHWQANWKVAGLILGQGTCLGCRPASPSHPPTLSKNIFLKNHRKQQDKGNLSASQSLPTGHPFSELALGERRGISVTRKWHLQSQDPGQGSLGSCCAPRGFVGSMRERKLIRGRSIRPQTWVCKAAPAALSGMSGMSPCIRDQPGPVCPVSMRVQAGARPSHRCYRAAPSIKHTR